MSPAAAANIVESVRERTHCIAHSATNVAGKVSNCTPNRPVEEPPAATAADLRLTVAELPSGATTAPKS